MWLPRKPAAPVTRVVIGRGCFLLGLASLGWVWLGDSVAGSFVHCQLPHTQIRRVGHPEATSHPKSTSDPKSNARKIFASWGWGLIFLRRRVFLLGVGRLRKRGGGSESSRRCRVHG